MYGMLGKILRINLSNFHISEFSTEPYIANIWEEKALPPFLGELLTQALLLEHREITKEIDEATSAVANTRLEGLIREELLSKESEMQQMIDDICQLVEEHAIKEEAILEMLRRAVEKKG